MKKAGSGVASKAQQSFLERINATGYKGIIAHGWNEAMAESEKYMNESTP